MQTLIRCTGIRKVKYIGKLYTSLHTSALAKDTERAYVEVSAASGLGRDHMFAV